MKLEQPRHVFYCAGVSAPGCVTSSIRVPASRRTLFPSDETVDTIALSSPLAAASVKPCIPITPWLFGLSVAWLFPPAATAPRVAPPDGESGGGVLRPIGEVCVVPMLAVLCGGPASGGDENVAGDANA